MNYSYEINEHTAATVMYGTETQKGTVTKHNVGWTLEEAKAWALETIQLIKDNDGVYPTTPPTPTVVTPPAVVYSEENL
jgi:hypothetical protein